MMTICPNCGDVLNTHGHCDLCGTKVVPNLNAFMDDDTFGHGTTPIELNIKVLDHIGHEFTIPLKGYIREIKTKISMFEVDKVVFTFTGRYNE